MNHPSSSLWAYPGSDVKEAEGLVEADFLLLEAGGVGGWLLGVRLCGAVWGSPGAADPLPSGTELRGGRHGSVREPTQENGVQGEAATRSPAGTHPPLPSVLGRTWPDPAQLAFQAGQKPQCHPPVPLWPPTQRCLSPCAGTPIRGQGRWGAATVNKGAERRPPATCRPPSSR